MGLHREGHVAEGLLEIQAVVGRLWRREAGELAARRPVEAPGIDHRTAHRGAVAGEELGGRVNDEIGAQPERTAEGRGRQGFTDDERAVGRRSWWARVVK